MIVKVQRYKKDFIDSYNEEIYSDVKKISKCRDKNEDVFLKLLIKDEELEQIVPITNIDENGNHSSLVGAVWLMNDEGKTIERLF